MKNRLLVDACGLALALSWWSAAGMAEQPAPGAKPVTIKLSSSAFSSEKPIPGKYTCEGDNASPPLTWSGVPEGTKSVALVCDDPDAPGGTWVHWVLYDLPPTTSALNEKVAPTPSLPSGGKQGTNSFEKIGYGGPCPPPGKGHHYFFKIYALDAPVGLKPGATKVDLLRAMEHHILGEGMLMGTYQRKK
jgi:Raf kinase inhibitor-like YbhB/YbcL family protein